MPANKKHCKAQIGKLAGLLGFPRDYPAAVTALIDTLAERARNDDHATHVIGTLLESAERCPTVADIIHVCQESSRTFARSTDPGCPRCIEGWRRVWYLVTMDAGARWKYERSGEINARELEPKLANSRTQCISEAVERCQCAGG
jgi:hypothetical protein